MAVLVHGVAHGANHLLVGTGLVGHIGQVVCHGFASDGHAVAVYQARIQQHLHHLGDATGTVQVDRQELAAGFEVTNDGHFLAHALKVVDGPFHACCMGDGQEMQHRVGRATRGHDDRHRVFNGLFGDDVAWLQVLLDGFNQHLGRFFG